MTAPTPTVEPLDGYPHTWCGRDVRLLFGNSPPVTGQLIEVTSTTRGVPITLRLSVEQAQPAWPAGRWDVPWTAVCGVEAVHRDAPTGPIDPNGLPIGQHRLAALQAAGWRLVPDQPEHQVELTDDGWALQHSLDCRLTGQLFDCPYTRAAHVWLHDAAQRGRYVALLVDGVFTLGDPR